MQVLDLKSIIYDGERGVAKKSVLQRELGAVEHMFCPTIHPPPVHTELHMLFAGLSKRKLQAGFGGPAVKRVNVGASRRRRKEKKNKNVDERNKRDKMQSSKRHTRAKALEKLKRKAELYDKLQNMNSSMLAKDDDRALSTIKSEMVVDFSKKEHLRASSKRSTSSSAADDEVVIEDEFGRTRTVKRGSRAHMKHMGSAYRHQKAELEHLLKQMEDDDAEHAPGHRTANPATHQAQPAIFIGGQKWEGGAVDQWARRLDREQRAHLEEIKAETTVARARSAEVMVRVMVMVRGGVDGDVDGDGEGDGEW